MQFKLTTPVLFLVFNRPSTTQIVFEAIRKAQPSKLYIAADGPRKNKDGEAEKCSEVRSIVSNVDWDCEVKTLFRDENLGCGKGVSSGITWFFENEPEGIILEDDCVPNESFFRYCSELLEYYRHDKRIMEISGNSIRPPHHETSESYSFSDHNGIWGWASWRRAWALYDYEMKSYKKVTELGWLNKKFGSIYEEHYFKWVFERTYLFPHITWDYQWEFVKRVNSGLTVVPQKNMVVNIGFGADATSTTSTNNPGSDLKAEQMSFPLKHPRYVMADKEADRQSFINHMTTFSSRIKSQFKNLLPVRLQERIFKYTMGKFVASQASDPGLLNELKKKSTIPFLSITNLLIHIAELDLQLLFVPVI